ncbi:nose resistant to fluoxetine protein 6 [Caerostris darwini]|uniref:Nose resistant to fluoxetine protein 6 n=1 Tax=Caerostris darwini TaxID=1538125 RepID=A0AAV4RRS7_9ARAC|nr:nose resistant to fluoxetine protein 6 [Caerostris darwini]
MGTLDGAVLDSWGKPGGGMFEGNLGHLGDYDECVDLDIPELKDPDDSSKHQRGKYCLSEFQPLLPKKPQLYTLYHDIPELSNISAKQTSFGATARNAHWFYLLRFRMGVCVPSACTAEDVRSIMEQVPKQLHISGTTKIVNCETKQHFTVTNGQIAIFENVPVRHIVRVFIEIELLYIVFKPECIFRAVIALFLLMMLVGTSLDVITVMRQGDDPEPPTITKKMFYRVLVCFSAYTNYLKLINVSVKEDNKHLSAVNGVRYITVTWVIVGHSYLYADYNQMTQGMRLAQLPPNFWFQAVANAMLTVDTFFLMSGMLVTYSVLKAQEKRKGLNVFMYIFHRFWRLTPPYAMTIAFLVLSPILASGPVWKITLDPLIKNCQANWWTNLLYVNNYVNTYDFCLEHTWYLGVDMQLHILGLFVLLPLLKWPKLGAFVGVVLTIGLAALAAIINLMHNFPPSLLGLFPDPDDRVYVEVPTYFKPYAHSGPYFVGMLLGYILVKKPNLIIPRGVRVCGWLFFSALQCTVLYGVYRWNNGAPYTPLIATLYAGTSKLVWSFGIFWMLLVCLTGNGGIINRILSWKFWVPMARLSYVFYLLHPLVIWVHEAFAHSNTYTSHYFWVYNILGHYMVTMVLSLIVSLTFEAPFLALEKILFGGGGNRSNREGQNTPPLKKVPELPSYDSELRPRSFTNGKQQHYPEGNTNGGYRNGGEGLYRPNRENGVGQQRGQENGAFCRL